MIECLLWSRGRLRDYRPSRGAITVALLDEASTSDPQPSIFVINRQ